MSDQRRAPTTTDRQIRRSQGQIVVARALWHVKPGKAEFRTERLPPLRPGEARVTTEFSAISRGTERLVASGTVPESEWQRMRAPGQTGSFSFPVKYGYSAVGTVTAGPEDLLGRHVFALHPHQNVFQTAAADLLPIPPAIPARRAVLAANMETALNAHWDAGTGPSDRVLIVGAGIVGLLVGYIARRIAGANVTVLDVDTGRARYAEALGIRFTGPGEIPPANQIVFHTSATAAGLQTAIEACAFEGSVIELSWYGTNPVTVNLGDAFHSQRLKFMSSQVGHVAANRRSQITRRERLQRAIALLDDPALDVLIENDIAFADLPDAFPQIMSSSGLPPIVRYERDR
jgi:NADPH:quinone reductase-like Zn-dependent oxidoreductase